MIKQELKKNKNLVDQKEKEISLKKIKLVKLQSQTFQLR